MDKRNFTAKSREKKRFFASGVAAANNHDIHVAIECAVASRAGGDSLAAEHFLFAGNAEQPRGCTGRNDNGVRFVLFIRRSERVGSLRKIDRLDEALFKARAESRGLLAEVVHEHETVDSFGESWEIFYFTRLGQLSAR